MVLSTVTDKGQTTVPLEIRSALGIHPRQRLVWETCKDGSAIVRLAPSVMELAGCMKSDVAYPGIAEETEAASKAWVGDPSKPKRK